MSRRSLVGRRLTTTHQIRLTSRTTGSNFMRASASGELVKGEVGQARLRRCGRLWEPTGGRASSKPGSRLATVLLAVAAMLVAAHPGGAAAVRGPDPHPSARHPTKTPVPDPSPASGQAAPTPAAHATPSVSSPPQVSERPVSATRPRSEPSAPSRSTVEARAKAKVMAAAALGAAASRARGGKQLRVAATSTPAEVFVARTTTDPMLLGAFALLTLTLTSSGLLLILQRSARQGARA